MPIQKQEVEMATEAGIQPMTIVSERLVAHPPEAIFAAFADPDRLGV